MTAISRAANKARFEDGDVPTQGDYENLIDSFISIVDVTAQSIASPLTAPSVTVSALSITGTTSVAGTLIIGASANTANVSPQLYGNLYMARAETSAVAPEIHFRGKVGSWLIGVDVANNLRGGDFVVAARNDGGIVNDIIYLNWNGGNPNPVTIGLGVTPPNGAYTVQVASPTADLTYGAMSILMAQNATGDALRILDSAGSAISRIDANGYLREVRIRDNTAALTNGPLQITNSAASISYGFRFNGNSLALRYVTGGNDAITIDTALGVLFAGAVSGASTATFSGLITGGGVSVAGTFTKAQKEVNLGLSYQTPATGGTITIGSTVNALVLNPAGTIATLTINMPASPSNCTVIRISTSQEITAVTMSGNGNTLFNPATTMPAGYSSAWVFITSVGWLPYSG